MGYTLVHRLVVDGGQLRAGVLGPPIRCRHGAGGSAEELELGLSDATPMLAVTNTSPLADRQRLAEGRQQPLGQSERRPGGAGGGIEHDVLVAREASNGGVLGRRLAESNRNHLQHFVAGCMAEAVVDVLETVEVDEVQRRMAVGLPGHPQALVDPFEQQRAVGKVRQRIGLGTQAQVVLGAPVGAHGLGDSQRDGACQHQSGCRPDETVDTVGWSRCGKGDDGDDDQRRRGEDQPSETLFSGSSTERPARRPSGG